MDYGTDLSILQNYDWRENRKKYKNYYKLDDTKFSIMLGYNGYDTMEHIPMINALNDLSQSEKEKCQIVIQMSYGSDDMHEYKKEIVKAGKEARLDLVFIDDFLGNEDIARLRMACDLFLYGEKIDAFSSSMIEYIYSGANVLCPEWTDDVYKSRGVFYYEYKDYSDIPAKVKYIMDNPEAKNKYVDTNRKILGNESMEAWTQRWRKMIEEMIAI